MGRLGAILVLAVLLGSGCASRPNPAAGSSATTSPPAPAPAIVGLETRPFSNKELVEELRRQGVGAPATGQPGAAGATGGTGLAAETVPEIEETPRGIVITFPHTYFAFDSFDLDAPARRVVERMAYVLSHPRAVRRAVVLEGHADAIGTEAYNLALSRQRADTVARELIGQGVQRERITVKAYGETRPVARNKNPDGTDNPEGRARNRRVEAVIQN
jgi:outer membrane protein OmpA-like peptidoglycan-associated protein